MGTGSFPGVKRPGRGVDHPPHLAPRLKEAQSLPLRLLLDFVACYGVAFGLCTLLPEGFSDFAGSVFFDSIAKQTINPFFNLLYKSSFRTHRSHTDYAVRGGAVKEVNAVTYNSK